MRFMNEYDVQDAERRFADHPTMGAAVTTLRNLVDWTNSHSDGWPYWPKPARAAARLMELIEGDGTWAAREAAENTTKAQVLAALRPIKAFRTRRGADFVIVEPS